MWIIEEFSELLLGRRSVLPVTAAAAIVVVPLMLVCVFGVSSMPDHSRSAEGAGGYLDGTENMLRNASQTGIETQP